MPFDNKELLQQQLEQAAGRRKPKGVELAKGVGIQYNAALQQLVREIKKDVDQQLMPLLRKLQPEYVTDAVSDDNGNVEIVRYSIPITVTDSWVDMLVGTIRSIVDKWSSPVFRDIASRIARDFVTSADQQNAKRFAKQFPTFGIDVFSQSAELTDYITTSIYDNTRLITSIPEQYLTQVESIVMTNVRAGQRPSAMAKLLQQQFGITQNRAKLIARDQTAKANGDLSAKRQQAVGFQYFQWVDSDDSRVRDRHEDIANKVTAYGKGIYRWDYPPLSSRGTPIIPGSDYQCRCIARPVSNTEVEANIKAGNTRPGVKR